MKSLPISLGVVLIGLFILGYSESWSSDWRLYAEGEGGKYYYDAENVDRPSKSIVRVWEKIDFNEKGVIEKVNHFGGEYKTLGHRKALVEFYCAEDKFRLLSITDYSKNGKVLSSATNEDPALSSIVSGSTAEFFYKAACKR